MMREHAEVIEYRTELSGLSEQDLEGFFEGWPSPPSAAALLRVLRNSAYVVLASDGGQVVGFVNALSDGELAAYLPLLEVRASHRGRGVGQELIRQMLRLLDDVYMVDVVCDGEVAPFYEGLGFSRLNGLVRRNRTAAVLSTG